MWRIIKSGYVQVWEMAKSSGRKGMQLGVQLLFGKKSSVSKVDCSGVSVSGLILILFSV